MLDHLVRETLGVSNSSDTCRGMTYVRYGYIVISGVIVFIAVLIGKSTEVGFRTLMASCPWGLILCRPAVGCAHFYALAPRVYVYLCQLDIR